jgi:ribosomal protein L7/L12
VCTNKKLAAAQTSLEKARQAEVKKQFNVKKNRNRGLVWGGITAVIMFVFMIFSVIDTDDVGATIGGGLLLTVLGFTYISQLFWDGAVLDCTLAGGKVIGTPGVIFTFDLDGFIFLIAMKILFAVIKFIVWLFTVVVCALAAIVISPFTFIPALMRVNKGVGISAKTNTQAKQFFNVVILNVPENKTQAIIAIREKTGLMLHEVAQALRVGSIFPKRFETEAEANECVSILGEYGVYAVVK